MKIRRNHLEGFIVLLLTGVFAVCLMIVLLTGANTYQRLTERGQESYNRRTCVQYIATKVRQNDSAGNVYTEQFGDGDALVLEENINGGAYLTRVYMHDGYLTELFSEKSAKLSPRDGERIMKISDFNITSDGGMLKIFCTDERGKDSSLSLSLRSGKGAL